MKKKRYIIEVREIHKAIFYTEAVSEDEAWENYYDGNGDWSDSSNDSYLDTLNSGESYTAPEYKAEEE